MPKLEGWQSGQKRYENVTCGFKFEYGFKDVAETYKILEPFPDTFSVLKYI